MSLDTNLQNLAQKMGNEMKALRTLLNGNLTDLSGLTTDAKNNIVAAINEVNAAVDAIGSSPGGATIDDTAASTSTVYSSSKSTSVANAAAAAAASGLINDTTASGTKVYSSTKVDAQITAASAQVKTDILGGATAAYDTLKELYDLLQAGDSADQTAIQNLTTALGTRVRFDAAQTITTAQQKQARDNIGAVASSDIGNTNTDFVAVFDAAYLGT